ncbi:MAG: Uma2 family endonuclease [Thermosynechococcaceae cyanobacterium]
MIASAQKSYLTPEDYLQLEESSPVKHEYIDGAVYAMAGASDAHVAIALNLAADLRSHLRGSHCRVYISDMKVQIESLNRYFYPDVMVTCDPRDQKTTTYKCFPKLIVEVLSTSTAAFDRGDKFADYQQLESLQEYVLINTHLKRVECYRRQEQGLWSVQFFRATDPAFELKSIDYKGSLETLYENVVFPSRTDQKDRAQS